MHTAANGVKANKVKPMKPYVTAEILDVSAHRARLIKTKHREEQQAKRHDRKKLFAVWRDVTHWVAGHRRPTHVDLDTFGPFRFRIYPTSEGKNVYHRSWRQAFQARAKAGRAEIAVRGYQRIQHQNLKNALQKYLAALMDQAATVSGDWWEKLKPLWIGTKGKKVPQYLQPIPEIVDDDGMPFATATKAADGW